MIRRWTGLPCLIGAVVAGTVGALWLSGLTFAEDTVPGTKPKPAAEAKDGEKPATEGEKPEAKPVDPFEVPEGTDSKVLNLFLSRLQRTPPKSRTPEGITEYLGKLEKVADELHSRELDDQMTEQAFGMKIHPSYHTPRAGAQRMK